MKPAVGPLRKVGVVKRNPIGQRKCEDVQVEVNDQLRQDGVSGERRV